MSTSVTTPQKTLLVVIASLWVCSHALHAADYSTFEGRKNWLLGLDYPTKSLESGESDMHSILVRLYQSNGNDSAALEYATQVLEHTVADVIFEPVGVVRALYMYRDKFSQSQLDRIEAAAKRMSNWAGGGTENHQLYRWTNGYLLAQAFDGEWRPFKEEMIVRTAEEMMEVMKDKIVKEGQRQYRRGVAEYLSPTYLVHHVIPMLNLYDFAEDPEIRRVAEAMLMRQATHLSLNVHEGVVIEPYQRIRDEQYRTGKTGKKNSAVLLAWLWWGWSYAAPGGARFTQDNMAGAHVVYVALSSFRPLAFHEDMARGRIGLPFTTTSSCPQWAQTGYHDDADLREVYRHEYFAMGAGVYDKFCPNGYYIQHNRFGITYGTNDPLSTIHAGHPYIRSDESEAAWWQSPTSPFQQITLHENTAVMMFNIPEKDPWAFLGRSDFWALRDGHADSLIQLAQVRYPRAIDNITVDTPWYFLREGGTYIAIRPLKSGASVKQLDRDFNVITSKHSQTGFIFEVGSLKEYSSFVAFMDSIKNNPVSVDWDSLDVSYTNSSGDVIRLKYNTNMEWSGHSINLIPDVWINGTKKDYTPTSLFSGPNAELKDQVLLVGTGEDAVRVDWTGDLPIIARGHDAPIRHDLVRKDAMSVTPLQIAAGRTGLRVTSEQPLSLKVFDITGRLVYSSPADRALTKLVPYHHLPQTPLLIQGIDRNGSVLGSARWFGGR